MSLETFECLSRAKTLFYTTKGALDVTLGRRTARLYEDAPADARPFVRPMESSSKKENEDLTATGMTYLKLDPATMTATRMSEAVQLDLGAVGKGFALDKMAESLRQWKLSRCLLHGGASTVLALDPPNDEVAGWPIEISCPTDHSQSLAVFDLTHSAFSGSAQTGRLHIIDPKTGEFVRDHLAAWAMAADAVTADGLSTAFMILSTGDIRDLCQKASDVGAAVVFNEENTDSQCHMATLGRWPDNLIRDET